MPKFSVYLTFSLTILSCNAIEELDQVDTTINRAIDVLDKQSDAWRTSLEQTREVLINEGQSTLANEITDLLDNTVNSTVNGVKCTTDFFRDRAKSVILRARATLRPKRYPMPPSEPAICDPVPDRIDMKLPEDRRSIVSFSGFNLKASTDPNAAHNVKLFLLKNDGATNTTIDVSQHLSMASPYEAMANLGKNGLQLDHLSERIELRSTTGGTVLSQIAVVQDKPREVIHLDCGDLTSAADNDALTMCPENAAVVGLAGGRGHGFDANEGHRFRCCKLGPVKITETCKELSTGVDSDTLTRPDEKGYVVTGIAGGLGHSSAHNLGHGIRFCKIDEAAFRVTEECETLETGVDSPELTACPKTHAITGVVGGWGHSSDHNKPHRIQCCKIGTP